MFSSKLFIFIFILYFSKISCQTLNLSLCYPIPIGINVTQIAQYQLQLGCNNLLPYTNLLDLTCCEIDFQDKENSSAPRRHGCMAFLKNYIDNDRYEDIIDWIERGKLDQFTTYAVFMGQTLYMNFSQYPLIKNESKYEVFKLDCFANFICHKFYLMFILALMILIIN